MALCDRGQKRTKDFSHFGMTLNSGNWWTKPFEKEVITRNNNFQHTACFSIALASLPRCLFRKTKYYWLEHERSGSAAAIRRPLEPVVS